MKELGDMNSLAATMDTDINTMRTHSQRNACSLKKYCSIDFMGFMGAYLNDASVRRVCATQRALVFLIFVTVYETAFPQIAIEVKRRLNAAVLVCSIFGR